MAILGFIVVFVLVVVGCVLGWDWYNGTSAFEKAQVGKRMAGKAESQGHRGWTDVEKGKGHGKLLSVSEGLRVAGSAIAKND